MESLTSQLIETNKKQYTNQLDGLQKEIEKSITGGKTLSDLKFDNETWIKGVQKELELEKLREKSRDLENETIKKRLEALDAQKEISKVEADYLEKQIDVLDLQEKLEKAKGKKDVQVLTRDENGNFNWGYEAKQDDVDKVKDDLDKAKGELDKFATSKKEEYLSKIGQIISGAKDGSLTPEEVKSRLAQLTSSYGEILKDIPSFDSSKLEDIIKIYDDYVSKNKGILDEYGNGTGISSDKNYEAIVNGFGEQFKIVSKDLGDIFGKELREALLLPQIDPSVIGKGNTMIIEHQTIELPNVTDAAGFEEVFRDLPDIARQVAQGK